MTNVSVCPGFQPSTRDESLRGPSIFTILPFIEYEDGVWHPQRASPLLTTLGRTCEELGVDVRTSSPVESGERRATGVVVDGVEHACDHVVLNADATWAMRHSSQKAYALVAGLMPRSGRSVIRAAPG